MFTLLATDRSLHCYICLDETESHCSLIVMFFTKLIIVMFTLCLLIVFSLFIMLYVCLLLPFLWWNKDVGYNCCGLVVVNGLLGKVSHFFLVFVRSCLIKYVFSIYRVVLLFSRFHYVKFCVCYWYLFRDELPIAVLTSWPLSKRLCVSLFVYQ